MANVGIRNSNVTAKCYEIRKLLKGDETSLDEDVDITRSIQFMLVLIGKCICCVIENSYSRNV